MATPDTVLAAIAAAYDEAATLAGKQTILQKDTALATAVAGTATALAARDAVIIQRDALQAKIDKARSDLA